SGVAFISGVAVRSGVAFISGIYFLSGSAINSGEGWSSGTAVDGFGERVSARASIQPKDEKFRTDHTLGPPVTGHVSHRTRSTSSTLPYGKPLFIIIQK
ncbi:MAG TPA: hypothetical protein PK489_10470, partial [Prolixibacteraceae bacterium]|nr:hypothetical protein [Prolixibacteraceae bacterium]